MIIVTSNKDKLREFEKYIPKIKSEKGRDLPEVKGDPDTVAIYKALMTGKDRVIEDTILIVDDEEVIDIKWKIKDLQEDSRTRWEVRLAYNDGEFIYVFKGAVEGRIVSPRGEGFSFDPYFQPDGSDLTLGELGEKRESSAQESKRSRPLRKINIPERLPSMKSLNGMGTGKVENDNAQKRY